MDVPFFVPTTGGPLSAIASLPDTGPVRGPAVVMLPGMRAERIRADVMRETARALASSGQPVLRVDYPGYGLAPGPERPRQEAERIFGEAAEWFRRLAGVRGLAVTGTCYGGTAGITIAANNPAVRLVVINGGRFRRRVGKQRSRLRAGIAALDWLGPRVADPITNGENVQYDENSWNERLLAAIESAAVHARLIFTYGSEDLAYQEFLELKSSGRLSRNVVDNVSPVVITGRRVNTVQDVEHGRWLHDLLENELVSVYEP